MITITFNENIKTYEDMIREKLFKDFSLKGKSKNKDIEISNETYQFYFNNEIKDLSNKNIRENSELIQG